MRTERWKRQLIRLGLNVLPLFLRPNTPARPAICNSASCAAIALECPDRPYASPLKTAALAFGEDLIDAIGVANSSFCLRLSDSSRR